MNRCDAVVIKTADAEVWLEVAGRAPICGQCKTADTCQNSLLGLSAAPRRYRLENRIGARVGERVSLTVAEGAVWRASLASYVLPLLLALAGAVVGQTAGGSDAGALLGLLAGLAIGLALLRRTELRARRMTDLFSLQVQSQEIRFKEPS